MMNELENDALSWPIENPSFEAPAEDMQDMKFIDINKFSDNTLLQTANIKTETIMDNEYHESHKESQLERNLRLRCAEYEIQLQRANWRVKTLENEVKALKSKIRRLKDPTERVLKKVVNSPKSITEVKNPNELRVKCKLCYKQLSNHQMNEHSCIDDLKKIQCSYCLQTFKTTNDLLNHIAVHQTALKIDRKHKFYKCEACSITYVGMKILLQCHRMSHIMGYDSDGIVVDEKLESLGIIIKPEGEFENSEIAEFVDSSAPIADSIKPSIGKSDSTAVVIASNDVFLKMFIGGECPASFETGKQLERHLSTHEKKPVASLTLAQMRKQNKTATSLTKICQKAISNQAKSAKTEYECYLCKHKYKGLGFMRRHMALHTNGHQKISNNFCSICQARVGNKMDSHLCGDADDVQCEYCPKRFTVVNKLLRHLDEMHETNRQSHQCETCSKYFPMMFLRDSHQDTHENNSRSSRHKERSNAEISGDHLCEGCGRTFGSAHRLERHRRTGAHSNPTFECSDCGKKFYTGPHLKRHSAVHSKNKITWVCDLCGKGFHTSDGLRKHKIIHTRTEADRRFECLLCSLKFFRAKDLKKHELKHVGMKQFQCQFCDNSYKYLGDLNKHLRLHLDGKTYECSICQMRFKYLQELQRHSFEHYKEEKEKNKPREEDPTEREFRE